jgi:uncharacterized protein YciI
MPQIHFAVIHAPGSNWKPGVAAREQTGLQGHVEHYRALFQAGKLKVGGPFLDEASGGIMVFESSVAESEAQKLATEDPAVKSGLLTFELRPWGWVFQGEVAA